VRRPGFKTQGYQEKLSPLKGLIRVLSWIN
jgi:hypothetical protein